MIGSIRPSHGPGKTRDDLLEKDLTNQGRRWFAQSLNKGIDSLKERSTFYRTTRGDIARRRSSRYWWLVIPLSYDGMPTTKDGRDGLQNERQRRQGQKRQLTHRNPITQRKRDTLRFAPDSNMPRDGTRLRAFDAEIGKCVLAYVHTHRRNTHQSRSLSVTRLENRNSPNRLLAYKLAVRKSHSPDMAPSGVKHNMLVDFMTCLR